MEVLTLLRQLKNAGITIQLMDDQLKLAGQRENISEELIAHIKNYKKEIISLLRESKMASAKSVIRRAEKKEYFPLSSQQERLFFIQHLNPESLLYNIFLFEPIPSNIKLNDLNNAISQLIKRHESLRTSFKIINDKPQQIVHDNVDFNIEYIDSEKDFGEIKNNFIKPFNLEQAPLFHIGMIKMSSGNTFIFIDIHHIISDAKSEQILLKEINNMCRNMTLNPLQIQYRDYCVWQLKQEQNNSTEKKQDYWLQRLTNNLPELDLPYDIKKSVLHKSKGNSIKFSIDETESEKLAQIGKDHNITQFTVTLSLYFLLLSKLSNQDDIIIGVPVYGREYEEFENVFGYFINVLPIRAFPKSNIAYIDFLKMLSNDVINAFANQEFQYEKMINKLQVNRDINKNPIFITTFNMIDEDITLNHRDIDKSHLEVFTDTSTRFDISLYVQKGKELYFGLEFDSSLFKKETIIQYIRYFKQIISQITSNNSVLIRDINLISTIDKQRIIQEFNNTDTAYLFNQTLLKTFDDQVHKCPDKTAVIYPLLPVNYDFLVSNDEKVTRNLSNIELSYKSLQIKSQRLAGFLRMQGLGEGNYIVILLEPTPEIMISILAVARLGAIYVPISTDFPLQRIQYVLSDTTCSALISNKEFIKKVSFSGISIDIYDEKVYKSAEYIGHEVQKLNAPFYTIYTSGTTGNPKGVLISNKNLMNYFSWFQNFASITQTDKTVLVSSFAYDACVTPLFGSILYGAELHILVKDIYMFPIRLINYIRTFGISYLKATPSLYSTISGSENFTYQNLKSLRLLIIGGEKIKAEDVKKTYEIHETIEIINHYGPTEVTVGCVACKIEREKISDYAVCPTIGKPIANTKAIVLDENGNILPVGIYGELCVAGDGVSDGYLNNPVLTKEKFIHSQVLKDVIVYKTGDRAKWMPDGNIELQGRIDHMEKVNGYRIELGEIENCLLKHDKIKEAIVLIKEYKNRNKYICAYIVGADISDKDLKDYLVEILPIYMIPNTFIRLDRLPTNLNNKVDRKSLPEPKIEEEIKFVAPRNMEEKLIAEVWADTLKKDKISIYDNYFNLGGDSITTIQIASKLNAKGYILEINNMFLYPTIVELAPYLIKTQIESDQSIIKGNIPLLPIQKEFFAYRKTDKHHYNHSVLIELKDRVELESVQKIVKKIMSHHDLLRSTFNTINNEVYCIVNDLDYPIFLDEYEINNSELSNGVFEAKCNELQKSLDLKQGSIFKVALFHLEDRDLLLIIAHHLVIDGVSWRILLEDLTNLFNQVKNGKDLELPLKTDSFIKWVNKLQVYANDELNISELEYWNNIEKLNINNIQHDLDCDSNLHRDFTQIQDRLDNELTANVLTDANKAFNTNTNELLITSLITGMYNTFKNSTMIISLEGHGRENLFNDINLNRTIGWFTVTYPVLFEIQEGYDLSNLIKSIKDNLRSIPNNGIGYGLLKYMTEKKITNNLLQISPQVVFNYLGQFDTVDKKGTYQLASLSPGEMESRDGEKKYEIEISVIIVNSEMVFTISYNQRKFLSDRMQTLLNNMKKSLNEIILLCNSKEDTEISASDFGYHKLSLERFEELNDEL